MEPVSVSIGALALVSLFSTCIECFEYVDAASTCGKDLELLSTQFVLERHRLLVWGDSVGLSSSSTAARLDTDLSHVFPILERILNCLCLQFQGADHLLARYGLISSANDPCSSSELIPQRRLRLLGLRDSYKAFVARVRENQQRVSTLNKMRWAVRDKEKFSRLVTDIHRFVDGLEAITKSPDLSTKRTIAIREELSLVEDLEDLRLIAEASAADNEEWCEAASAILGGSVSGDTQHAHIREWMSLVSDAKRSVDAMEGLGSDSASASFSPQDNLQVPDDIGRLPVFDMALTLQQHATPPVTVAQERFPNAARTAEDTSPKNSPLARNIRKYPCVTDTSSSIPLSDFLAQEFPGEMEYTCLTSSRESSAQEFPGEMEYTCLTSSRESSAQEYSEPEQNTSDSLCS